MADNQRKRMNNVQKIKRINNIVFQFEIRKQAPCFFQNKTWMMKNECFTYRID